MRNGVREDWVEVRNAADAEQVKRATRKSDRADRDRLALYREVLATIPGRAVFWDLLERAGIFSSVFALDPITTAFRAGQQDFGHALLATLLEADEPLYLQMETEARARDRRARAVAEAAHTPAADTGVSS